MCWVPLSKPCPPTAAPSSLHQQCSIFLNAVLPSPNDSTLLYQTTTWRTTKNGNRNVFNSCTLPGRQKLAMKGFLASSILLFHMSRAFHGNGSKQQWNHINNKSNRITNIQTGLIHWPHHQSVHPSFVVLRGSLARFLFLFLCLSSVVFDVHLNVLLRIKIEVTHDGPATESSVCFPANLRVCSA